MSKRIFHYTVIKHLPSILSLLDGAILSRRIVPPEADFPMHMAAACQAAVSMLEAYVGMPLPMVFGNRSSRGLK